MNLRVFMFYGSFRPLGSRELAGSCSPYPLAWSRLLIQNETAALVNNTKLEDWVGRCELLLEDALAASPREMTSWPSLLQSG